MLATSYEVTNNWGCALCGFFPPPHFVHCSHSAWSVCWWLFNKSLSKKIVCRTNYWKPRMQLSPRSSAEPDAELTQPGALAFLVRLPNCPDSWHSIFDINKWLGQSPHLPALASFTLKPFFRKESLQFKGWLHFGKTQAKLLVLRLLKFQFYGKVLSALMICLIVEYFPKTSRSLFCFQPLPILWEQREPNIEILSFKTLLCIFFPTKFLAFPCRVFSNQNLSYSWGR